MAPRVAVPANKPKPKTHSLSPSQIAPQKPSIDDLFLSLDRHVKAADFKQIVKTADQILALAPADADALLCKVVALIQGDSIDEAISVIESNQNSSVTLNYHKAYCLYRKNHLQEAMLALKGLERNLEVLQLEAQILYRQGDLNACISSYQSLLQNYEVNSNELKTNLVAAYVSGGRSSEVPSLMESMKVMPRNSFELAYNAACALIERESYTKAEDLLLLARRIGQETLIEEEYTTDEIENELAPISVQLAYVQQAQGRTMEALESYSLQLKQKFTDASSMAVACNNLTVLKGNKDLFDSIKKFEKLFEKKASSDQGLLFVEGLEHKLSLRQKEAISFNRFLVLLLSNKLDQARELLRSLFDKFPDSVMPALLNASLLVREGKLSRAEEMLGQCVEKHPRDSAIVLLVRAQIAAMAGHHIVAAHSLEQISDLQNKPAMVATLVALKEKGGDVRGAEATLDSAVQWWEDHMSEDTSTLELLMQEAAAFKLRHKNLEAASLLFQKLTKSSSPTVRAEALIGLVRSAAYTDLAKAEEYERQLPSLPGLSGIDVTALEQIVSTVNPTIGGKRPWTVENAPTEGASESAKNKARKKRKKHPRYPKGFDPANPGPPPDPERWLPKRERSTYRPKRKDRRGIQVRGAQGSIAKEKVTTPATVTSNGPSASGPSKLTSTGKAVQSLGSNAESSKGQISNSNKSKKKSRR